MTEARAAVIGLGGMGMRHLQALRAAGLETIAVCDRQEARFADVGALAAAKAGAYSDWRRLLEVEAKRLDLLVIATNGPSHHAIALAAAGAGVRHLVCEKPLATSGRKAREIAEACRKAGARLAVNHSRRFSERFRRLRELVRGGAIGRFLHANVSAGAGGLGCIGTHYFDLVSWLADAAPVQVVGMIDADPAPNVRGAEFFDPGGRGFVRYSSGASASYQLSGEAPVMPLLQFICSEGYVELTGWAGPGGRIEAYARPAAERAAPKTRSIAPERVAFDAGPPLDLVDAARRCYEDLFGPHLEQTVPSAIAAVDTVMAFHLSSQRGGAAVALPLAGEDLAFEVAIT
jgi:predicted dehydrogenase